jgi:hypothetical protein
VVNTTGTRPDLASRSLALVLTLLPLKRRDWGLAMQAELATLRDPASRRSYAGSCVRAACTAPGAIGRLVSRAAVATMAILAIAFAGKASAAAGLDTVVVLVVLGGLSWCGMRSTPLGPVGNSSVARVFRMAGYLLVGALLLWFLHPRSGGPTHDPTGFWMMGATVVVYHAGNLYLTARARPRALQLMGVLAVAVLVLWWTSMLLSLTVREHPDWTAGAMLGAALLAPACRRWLGFPAQVALAGLGAAVASGLLIFLAAGATYALAPSLVPDVTGTSVAGGLTAADRAKTNQQEAMDPYVAELLLGALAGLMLIASTGARPSAPAASTDDADSSVAGQAIIGRTLAE